MSLTQPRTTDHEDVTRDEKATAAAPAPVLDVAVVIVTYETPDHLTRCLDSLDAEGVLGRAPVVVIDNSASDDCAVIASARAGVQLIKNDKNVGYARAVNQGIHASETPFVLVLNPDIELRPGSVAALRAAMDREPAAGIAAAKLLNPDGSLQLSCRKFYTLGTIVLRRTFLGKLFPNHRLVREHLMLDWEHDDVKNVDWVLGACLMVRRAAIDDVGPMDERFFLYFEDVDWCARMHKHGWQVLYVPHSVMVHHHRRESARGGPLSASARMHLASVVRFWEKWSLVLYVLKRQRATVRVMALLAADLVSLNAAFLLAFGTRDLLSPFFDKPLFPVVDYWQFLLVYNVVSLLALNGFGLYRAGRPTDPVELALRVLPSLVIASLSVLVSTFLLYIRAYSRFIIVLNLPLAVLVVTAVRVLMGRVMSGLAERGLAARRVLMAGDAELCGWMSARLERVPGIRYEVVGVVELDPHGDEAALVDRVRRLCHVERVSEFLVADAHGEYARAIGALSVLESEGVRVRLVSDLSRTLGPGVALEQVAGVPVVAPLGSRGGARTSAAKRTADVCVAALLLPWVGLPALWIRLVAALGAGTARATRPPAVTAAGEPAWSCEYEVAGSATGSAGWLRAADALWQILRGRLSLVGVHRYARVPDPPVVACRGVRPGLVTPPAGGRQNCLEADQAYVLGWSAASDLRLLCAALRDRDAAGSKVIE